MLENENKSWKLKLVCYRFKFPGCWSKIYPNNLVEVSWNVKFLVYLNKFSWCFSTAQLALGRIFAAIILEAGILTLQEGKAKTDFILKNKKKTQKKQH